MCANPSHQGVTLTTSNTSKTGGRIAANRVDVASDTTAISLAMNIPAGPVTGQIRLGLYNDTGTNYPNMLLAQTDPFFPVLNAWNTVDIDDIYLPAGTYWIAELYSDSSSNGGTWAVAGTWLFVNNFGWSMLPSTFPAGGGAGTPASSSVYMNTCP